MYFTTDLSCLQRILYNMQSPNSIAMPVQACTNDHLSVLLACSFAATPHSSVHARALATIHKGRSTKIYTSTVSTNLVPRPATCVLGTRYNTKVSSEQMPHRLGYSIRQSSRFLQQPAARRWVAQQRNNTRVH